MPCRRSSRQEMRISGALQPSVPCPSFSPRLATGLAMRPSNTLQMNDMALGEPLNVLVLAADQTAVRQVPGRAESAL